MSYSFAFPLPSARRAVLADLIPGASARALTRDTALAVTGAGLAGVAAQVSIHTSLSPVPFTLQTLAVLVVGAALGPARGVLSMAIYLAAGCAGTPWFAPANGHPWSASGWDALGPSAGYALAFLPAAGIVGALARRGADRNILTAVALMIGGNVVIYALGVSWLHHASGATWSETLYHGIVVFLPSDALKLVIAALAFPTAWRLARH